LCQAANGALYHGDGSAIDYSVIHDKKLTRLRLRPTSGVVLPEEWLRG
jgi:hypothetical protein